MRGSSLAFYSKRQKARLDPLSLQMRSSVSNVQALSPILAGPAPFSQVCGDFLGVGSGPGVCPARVRVHVIP